MSFKKPYRICNKSAADGWSLIPDAAEPVCATLREMKDRYELRISIPGAQEHVYSITIRQGILYVYDAADNKDIGKRLFGAFILPANIQWDKVRAYHRSYGLEIVLPMAPHDGIAFSVPVIIRENEKSF